jgi:hypothetical protein
MFEPLTLNPEPPSPAAVLAPVTPLLLLLSGADRGGHQRADDEPGSIQGVCGCMKGDADQQPRALLACIG